MTDERETLTWETFGGAAQELARVIADDGFRPDLILAIAHTAHSRATFFADKSRRVAREPEPARNEFEARPTERKRS